MQYALLYEETPDDLQRVEDFARRRRLELIAIAGPGSPEDQAGKSSGGALTSSASIARVVWDNVSDGLRSQEVLKTLPGEESDAMTPTEMAEEMEPADDGQVLRRASVRASILNIRRVEKRLREEGRIQGRLVQAEWSDGDGANRYYLRPEDHGVIAAL